jgi:glutamate racemase
MPDDRAIGVFDSGVGGLTVLAALARQLPGESLVYLGDTARVPYGTRSPRTVMRFACEVANALVGQDIKAMVVACNTATTYALEALRRVGKARQLPVFGVIEPGVREALARSKNQNVLVLGTEGTVRGGRYQTLLRQAGATPTAVACPLFVPLAEEGWHEGHIANLVASRYLENIAPGPDTVILGCTHYPLLRSAIAAALPPMAVVDSATATARLVHQELTERDLLRHAPTRQIRFLVTDNLARFRHVGKRIFGAAPEPVELIDLVCWKGPFNELSA